MMVKICDKCHNKIDEYYKLDIIYTRIHKNGEDGAKQTPKIELCENVFMNY
jgi:hypothetical protein